MAVLSGYSMLIIIVPQVMIREAKRQNAAYRQHAIPALGKYAAARTDKDLSDTVHTIVRPILDELVGEETEAGNAMDVDGVAGKERDNAAR